MHRFRFPPGVVLMALVVATVVAAGAIASIASSSRQATRAITPSPVWPAKTLMAPAGDNWYEYYGALTGQRYSSLKQITTSNVGQLKQVWQISLGTCTASLIAGDPVIPGAPRGATNNPTNCGSMESNPVAIDGVLYTTNAPLGEVWAIDAKTGATIWKWTPSYAGQFLNSGAIYSPGNGGRRAGVAVGEGLVFNGLPDGRLVALNQVTGRLEWEAFVGSYKRGSKISTAPIYVNGIVLTGDGSGDNSGVSASVQAFRASNGGKLWSWSAIPHPGQPGYETWTNDGKGGTGSSDYGGGSIWESPIVDANRRTLYVGTGNPEPWNSRGPGANLYTDAIVALDLYTGQLKWHYQVVHHDLWDSDLPNNGVLFDGKFKVGGKLVTRPAVAYVNKVGMTFVLDRQTGKPLIPVDEVPVPQSTAPGVNTWPTQPVPRTDNVLFNPGGYGRPGSKKSGVNAGIPCTTPDAVNAQGVPFATATAPDGKPYKLGCSYDPYDTTQYVVVPFEMMDWPASSYSPENKTMITCGVTGRARAMQQIPAASQTKGQFGGLGVNQLGVSDGSTPISNSGNFASLNLETGRLAWHQHWREICYSGSVNTAGGVTFVGHAGTGDGSKGDGYLEAVDTKTGASLWKSPLMPYPAVTAPITYTVDGKQYVTIEVGGAAHNDVSRPFGLLDSRRVRGDYIYTFALP